MKKLLAIMLLVMHWLSNIAQRIRGRALMVYVVMTATDSVSDTILDLCEQVQSAANGRRLPPFYISQLDDGSVLLEWFVDDLFTAGFNIECDPKESGWFYTRADGEHIIKSARGQLLDPDFCEHLAVIVDQVAGDDRSLCAWIRWH